MILLFVSFFSSLLLILGIIRYKHLHEHLSGDHDLSGPQKFHQGSIPRIVVLVFMLHFGLLILSPI
jgi:hypothetical protein